jgi:hypothetical protein
VVLVTVVVFLCPLFWGGGIFLSVWISLLEWELGAGGHLKFEYLLQYLVLGCINLDGLHRKISPFGRTLQVGCLSVQRLVFFALLVFIAIIVLSG